MVYLDYSATTPVCDEVIDSFVKASKYIGNPNSLHKLGSDAKKLIDASTRQVADLLGVKESEVIYTSGASEANNTAIKGICLKYKNRGNHIITTKFEHSSIYGPINYLIENGFKVDYVKTKENGLVDLQDLEKLINDDTILVSIGCVNSEIGIRQPIEEIAEMLLNYNKIYFHTDITQAMGKVNVDLTNVDLASFSAHKFFGFKGIGCLIKKEKIMIEPLVAGGKSTTIFRSGTPTTELIVSLSKALRLALENSNEKYNYVKELNDCIKNSLKTYNNVYINSNENSIPQILNLSVIGVKPEVLLHALEQNDIYISTKSACSISNKSEAVYTLTKSNDRALSSVRISLSYKTTKKEVDTFLEVFDKCYKKLTTIKK